MSIVRCAIEQRNFEPADAYLELGLEYCRERGLDTWRRYLWARSRSSSTRPLGGGRRLGRGILAIPAAPLCPAAWL